MGKSLSRPRMPGFDKRSFVKQKRNPELRFSLAQLRER
jgi:hypothetical protein